MREIDNYVVFWFYYSAREKYFKKKNGDITYFSLQFLILGTLFM